ncbi:P1 family peptidase [Hwanghaeella sp. LZ110]|uniref:P1 family peptidase n=1 Tax=Hwanghaeella sp. LZ110 TaxID=3402810 RepID=UPI003B6798B6
MSEVRPGPGNALTDVAGLTVGNAHDVTCQTGTTVILCGENRAVAAVDVRGGGPGTRETDALAPGRLVQSVDAVVLSGGSAFGLDAAGSVQLWLAAHGLGYKTGGPLVPIVPAAILFDLVNGGDKDWGMDAPYRALGLQAIEAAGVEFAQGKAGAGYGARAGGLEGGLGSASAVDPVTGATVGALVAVNCFGDVCGDDGRFYAAPFELGEEFGGCGPSQKVPSGPVFPKLGADAKPYARSNTTIAVVATDAALSHEDTQRFVTMAQAGLARAVRPVYTPFDGDTVFALATAQGPSVDAIGLARLGAIGADVLARAIARGVYEARSLGNSWPAWRDKFNKGL